MQRYLRRFIALAILPLVAGTALASSPATFVCRGDSIARPTCCCPESQHRAPTPTSPPTLSSACCCDISQVSVPTIPAVLDPEMPGILAHHEGLGAAVSAAMVDSASSLDARPVLKLAHAVPILLGKQSLLI